MQFSVVCLCKNLELFFSKLDEKVIEVVLSCTKLVRNGHCHVVPAWFEEARIDVECRVFDFWEMQVHRLVGQLLLEDGVEGDSILLSDFLLELLDPVECGLRIQRSPLFIRWHFRWLVVLIDDLAKFYRREH